MNWAVFLSLTEEGELILRSWPLAETPDVPCPQRVNHLQWWDHYQMHTPIGIHAWVAI
jgi:hypothetical protein